MNRPLLKNKRVEVQGTISAGGTATLVVPVPIGPSWEVKQITVSCTSVLESVCTTYVGTNSSGVEISQTLTGNSDTDSQPNVTARSGEAIAAVWTGATSGALARLTVIYDEVGY